MIQTQHIPVATIAVLGMLLGGCMSAPAPPPPQALGCFAVSASGWSEGASRVTGLANLPGIVSLDSSFAAEGGRRVLVPRSWRDDPPRINVATWSNELGEWRRLDDSVFFVRSSSVFHTLGNDSITVTWRGWGGWLTAYLALASDGYAGLGQLVPRPLAAGLAPITVRLRRVPCPRDSVDWAAAPPNPRLQRRAYSAGSGW